MGRKIITRFEKTAGELCRRQSKKKHKKSAFDFLNDAGFIGGVNGEVRDSIDYKAYVSERIKKKYENL